MTIDRLSADDRMLLLSDRAWPQDVGVVVLLEAGALLDEAGRFPVEVARRAIARGLPGLPRLRQVLRVPPRGLGGPFWVDAPAFDLAQHVRLGPRIDSGGEAALLGAVEEIRSRRLDRAVLCGRCGSSRASTLVAWGCSCGCTTSWPTESPVSPV